IKDFCMNTENPELREVATPRPVRSRAIHNGYEAIKPLIDPVLALVMLLLSAPVILLSMVLVRLSSRGPAIYTQKRLGLGGKVFTIYKIRTMYQDSERDSGPTWCVPDD